MARFQSLPLAMLLILCASVCGAANMTLNNTMLLMGAPPALHGRVIIIFTMTAALTPIGALPMETAADLIGIPTTFLIVGPIAMLFAIVLWLCNPAMNRGL